MTCPDYHTEYTLQKHHARKKHLLPEGCALCSEFCRKNNDLFCS